MESSALYKVGKDRQITYWNKAAEDLTGYLAHEVVGRHCQDGLLEHCDATGQILCGTQCPLLKTIESGETHCVRLFLRHAEGHRVAVTVEAEPIVNEQGEIVGATEKFWRSSGEIIEKNRTLLQPYLRDAIFKHPPVGLLVFRLTTSTVSQHYGPRATEHMHDTILHTLSDTLPADGRMFEWDYDTVVTVLPNMQEEELIALKSQSEVLIQQSRIEWWGLSLGVPLNVTYISQQPGESAKEMLVRAAILDEKSVCQPALSK